MSEKMVETTGRDLRGTLAALVSAHGTRWHRAALRIVGNNADAQDAVQEAIHRILVKAPLFQSADEARMYVARAITNHAIELHRARRKQNHLRAPLDAAYLLAADASSPEWRLVEREQSIERAHLLNLIQEGLDRLHPKRSEALGLILFAPRGKSMRTVGAGRGIPYSTLRHRSVQALRELRKFILRELTQERRERGSPRKS